MDETSEIRWMQRFSNYKKALSQFEKFIAKGPLNELEEQGNSAIHGSRDATREAFKLDLIEDGDSWMDMIKDRNRTSHTYNQATADLIAENIVKRYSPLFLALRETMQGLENAC